MRFKTKMRIRKVLWNIQMFAVSYLLVAAGITLVLCLLG